MGYILLQSNKNIVFKYRKRCRGRYFRVWVELGSEAEQPLQCEFLNKPSSMWLLIMLHCLSFHTAVSLVELNDYVL